MNNQVAILFTTACLQAASTFAQPLDGMYVQENFTTSCQPDLAGMDGGPALVDGERLVMLDTWCTLENPVDIRNMNATLYDATCFVSGYGSGQHYRVLLGASRDGGLMVVFDDFAFTLPRCAE